MEGLKEFLTFSFGDGYGYGSGYGYGYGDGDGYGSGSGYGYGNGNGNGYGYGSGSGDGNGYGNGYGYGDGYGDGNGYGYGYGDGYGYGLKEYDGNTVYFIDNIPTVILSVKRFIARGYTIKNDLTISPCYIVRVGNSFAHGKTIKEAQSDAESKHLLQSPVEERIDMFLKSFKETDKISAKDLYDWHSRLTGSCSYGKDEFIKSNGIDVSKDSFTIHEFIDLTIDSYGGDVIRQLKETIKQN